MVKREGVCITKAVVKCRCGIPVVVRRARMLVRLLARGVQALRLATPVIFVLRGVDVVCYVVVIVSRKRKVETLNAKITLELLHRGHKRVTTT